MLRVRVALRDIIVPSRVWDEEGLWLEPPQRTCRHGGPRSRANVPCLPSGTARPQPVIAAWYFFRPPLFVDSTWWAPGVRVSVLREFISRDSQRSKTRDNCCQSGSVTKSGKNCVYLEVADTLPCCVVAAMLHVIQLLGAPIYVLRYAYTVPLTIGVIFGCLHQFTDSRQVIGAVLHFR